MSPTQLRYFSRAGTTQCDLVTQGVRREALPFPSVAAARAARARDVREVCGMNGPARARGRKHTARVAGKGFLFHFKEHKTG